MKPHDKFFFRGGVDSLKESQLERVFQWLRAHFDGLNFQQRQILRLELAIEEALMNAAEHAYEGKEGTIELSFEMRSNNTITICITDFGPPFDPLTQAPDVDFSSPLEKRNPGGLGIFLMKKAADQIQYIRKDNANNLFLSIFLK